MFIKNYIAKIKSEFSGYNLQKFSKDLMAGLTVTAVALPLALAFGVSCGATAEAGLVTAIIAGLIMSALAGASYQISGPTGAMSAILVGIVGAQGGIQSMFVVSVLAGIIIILCAVLKLGRLVSMIPRPVITGFTSGIALTIALGQIDNFFGTTSQGANPIEKIGSYFELGFNVNWRALLIGAIVIAIMLAWPKKLNSKIPSSLVGIIVATVVSLIFGFGEHVSLVGEIPQKLMLDDRFDFAKINWGEFTSYISPAVSIASLALIESLLCGASASKMKGEKFDANQEIIAQGIGNIIIPFFGGVPATAAIARTSVAIKSGAQTRLCGIIHAIGLLISMFLLAPIMAKIPLSALAGVLLVTAWRMNEWAEIKTIFSKKMVGGIIKFLATMISTIVFDLTIAIVIGIVLSAFIYIYRSSSLKIEKSNENEISVSGPLFFANAGKLEKAFEELDTKEELTLNINNVTTVDTTGASVLYELMEELKHKGISVKLVGVGASVLPIMNKLGYEELLGKDNFVPAAV